MYSLQPNMMTGIAQVDAEHHDLVAGINRIHAAERQGSVSDVLKQLQDFRDDLAGHFESEEHYLRILSYPAAEAHAEHHGEIIAALDRLLDAVVGGLMELGRIAEACFSELLEAVFTMDFKFLDWYAAQKNRV